MRRLIGNPANRCTRRRDVTLDIISSHPMIKRLSNLTTRVIPRPVCTIIRSVVKHTFMLSRRFPGRFITGFFGLFPNPVKGKSPNANNKGVSKREIRPYCNSKKNHGKQKYFYFPLLLYKYVFNLFNDTFRHLISHFIDLTCLKHRGIQHVKQEKISFCIYKQNRENSDPSSLRVKI